MAPVTRIESRHNPHLARARRLQSDPQAYRRLAQVWLEGEHLVQAAVARGHRLDIVLVDDAHGDNAAYRAMFAAAGKVLRVESRLWCSSSTLESPAPIAALAALPPRQALRAHARTVVLDRIQDAGNVGSVLRSAAAFGVGQVIALKGCAALWSPKVLRAAMGAHFALQLHEEGVIETLDALAVPLLATSSHGGDPLTDTRLPDPCAWLFGHEGHGVADELLARCALRLRIPQPGGEESINVAAAAAVCLYESMRQRDRPERDR